MSKMEANEKCQKWRHTKNKIVKSSKLLTRDSGSELYINVALGKTSDTSFKFLRDLNLQSITHRERAMAGTRPMSIIVSLMILALVLSPAPTCLAAPLNERGRQIIINQVRVKPF
ncbi:hypothetical protein SAY86_026643 [Trapa natans]|uniref:Uncharacterized protein n=1 Tax=Trapa natans TaxID=22666 RepID=A0AAN7KB57_TRANT|nr:hypothetical protein SAY86_026643 [Trapa natans]